MKDLIYKELMLAMHPAAILFLCLSSMLMIPSYPYFIIFFYTCLGVFFICMSGRENKDIYYTMLLPAEKRGIVAARFLLVVLIELLQFAAAVPFALLRSAVYSGPNEAGMNVNAAFFGFAFLMLGLFNLVFFTKYYKNPNKVGVPFLLGCIAFSVCMLFVEASRFAVPFVEHYLNAPGAQNLPYQAAVLAIGAALWALLTAAAYRRSVKSFEAFDL
ncbi:ABC-2 transporter permease [Christensenella intestinihominis]|uniref:ABC-2 transporter permease n=1 Tax=Christensenella intestinihominis TaxID=1851429 RepID=UPI000833A91E|nr:ABC-2 transporter permease [Christensenella intestinihominis]